MWGLFGVRLTVNQLTRQPEGSANCGDRDHFVRGYHVDVGRALVKNDADVDRGWAMAPTPGWASDEITKGSLGCVKRASH